MLHPLAGHLEVRKRLAEARAAGRLPQVMLLTGPVGIGKQRLALWLAQLALCERPAGEPCGECRSCRQVLGLAHPDLHWFVPIPRLKAGDSDKQIDEAADLLGEAIAARRSEPLYRPADGMSTHPIASARLLLRRAAMTPVQGSRKVFVVGEADRLVPQESSPDSANALLKFLEEPPADTWVVLTTTEPERVLPTIRSRAVPVRLARLPDAVVKQFAEERLPDAPRGAPLDALVRRANGAIGRLLENSQAGTKAAEDARALLEAIRSGKGARYERALRQLPWSARGPFTEMLDALADELELRARGAAPDGRAGPLVSALELVQAARAEAQGNVNPQLLLASLAGDLAEVL